MNRETIISMQTGRELDDLVNELILGQCRHEWEKSGPNAWNYTCRRCNAKGGSFINHSLVKVGDGISSPSTDIAAAWEVAEKFGTYQVTKMHGVELPWAKEDMYRAIVKANKFTAHAKTAPLAICRAALLATLEAI